MQYYLRLFVRIVLMRAPPQELPASPALFGITFSLLFAFGLLIGALIYPASRNLVFNLVDLGLLLLYVYGLVVVVRRPSRFLQTATAVCGIYILFYAVHLPVAWLFASEPSSKVDPIIALAQLFTYLMLFYSVMVVGHILRHALDTTLVIGVLVALAYSVANIFIMSTLFPRPVA